MATQTVHNISYLINDQYALNGMTGKVEVACLPAGSILVSAGVEVLETSDATNFKLGTADEGGFLINSGALGVKGYIKSDKKTQLPKDTPLYLELTGTATKGLIAVRILYFTPSKYVVEY